MAGGVNDADEGRPHRHVDVEDFEGFQAKALVHHVSAGYQEVVRMNDFGHNLEWPSFERYDRNVDDPVAAVGPHQNVDVFELIVG